MQLNLLLLLVSFAVGIEQYITTNITLTDNQYFVDLSQNNFISVGVTYSYLVLARPGKKVSLYFTTSIEKEAIVTVYDGVDTNASRIDTSPIINFNFTVYHTNAPRLISTGQFMLIQIKPTYDSGPQRYTQDFQPIVSDYEPPAGCNYLVQSVSIQTTNQNAVLFNLNKGPTCQMVIHVTDTTNAALLASYFSYIEVTGLFNIFKGLLIDDKHKLRTDLTSMLVFDRNTVVQYNANGSFVFQWDHASQYDKYLTINDNGEVSSFMTQDYLPYGQKMTDNMQQSFAVIPNGRTYNITLNILRPIGAGTVQILATGNGPDQQFNYSAANIETRLVFNCYRLYLNYSSPIGQNNGLYATYEAAFDRKARSANYLSLFTVAAMVIYFHM